MPLGAYEKIRKAEATRLGVRASVLDVVMVKGARAALEPAATGGQGRALDCRD